MTSNPVATIRSSAGYIVGAVVAALTNNFGIEIDAVSQDTLTAAVAIVIGAIYGAAVRFAAARWPSLGYLLVVPTNPNYGTQPMKPGPPV